MFFVFAFGNTNVLEHKRFGKQNAREAKYVLATNTKCDIEAETDKLGTSNSHENPAKVTATSANVELKMAKQNKKIQLENDNTKHENPKKIQAKKSKWRKIKEKQRKTQQQISSNGTKQIFHNVSTSCVAKRASSTTQGKNRNGKNQKKTTKKGPNGSFIIVC
jgi:hypothetical protein